MTIINGLFTSESVSSGHPDKICDQISDSVLDAFLSEAPEARVACETLASKNTIILAGEYRGPKNIFDSLEDVVRSCVRDIGFQQEDFHWETLDFKNLLHGQSTDIAQGVDATKNKDEGAGDQGLMFGYAIDEAPECMPATLYYSHRILQQLEHHRKLGTMGADNLLPDAKSQVTLEYSDGKPINLKRIVVSSQHTSKLSNSDQVKEVILPIAKQVLPEHWVATLPENEWLINPTGLFLKGGPAADCGLTGRKIIVDTYGGAAPHGGGAFSGKDPTKVDRSGAYAARYLAKNVVAAGLASKCLIQLSYAIGKPDPTSFYIDTFSTAKVDHSRLYSYLWELINDHMRGLTPRGIREHLQLNSPIYKPTATYGHFGRIPGDNGEFTWEKLDLVDDLKSLL
ncbi:MAG: methionine adenosyltransferase [Rhodobacteraceae bacterium]|nr:methionine adenosyltransferase [Paracoccaceae bacterium]